VSSLDLCDDLQPNRWNEVVPKEGFIVEQGDLGGQGLVEVMGARELPISSTASCCIKEIN